MKKELTQTYLNWLDRTMDFSGMEGVDINQLKNRLANDLAERKLKQINK